MTRKTEYTLDLLIKDDEARSVLHDLQGGIRSVSQAAKRVNLHEGVKKAEEASAKLIDNLKGIAKDTDKDFQAAIDAYSKGSEKAIRDLEKQYGKLRENQMKGNDLVAQRNALQAKIEVADKKEAISLAKESAKIDKQLNKLQHDQVQSLIDRNRLVRASLTSASKEAKIEHANTKLRHNQAKLDKVKAKTLKDRLKHYLGEGKAIKQTIKSQEAYLKAIKDGGKAQEVNVKTTSKLVSRLEKAKNVAKGVGHFFQEALQGTYNVAGLAGGAGRMASKGVRALGGAVTSVVQGAEREVEKEHAMRRIRGSLSEEEKRALLVDLYVKTGADYSTIVEAIGRVQSVLGVSVREDDLRNATIAELRYPGSVAMLRQDNTGDHGIDKLLRYSNAMRAMQSATGASEEQVSASTEKIANMRQSSFSNARLTELQGVYLGLQNSGGFDTQDELDKAFNAFVRMQSRSGGDVFVEAQGFDWERYAQGATNKQQLKIAMGNMQWDAMKAAANTDDSTLQTSQSEMMAEKMRIMEEKKNELLMKLIPAVMPLIDEIAKILTGPEANKLIKGITDIFMTLSPMLAPVLSLATTVLEYLDTYILQNLKRFIDWGLKFFGGDNTREESIALAANARANGGVIFGPALVGERAFQPEMILPLDFSRRTRASNIVSNVTQTFNMSGTETTSLSLAQAVKSRDFRLATSHSEFIFSRGGIA